MHILHSISALNKETTNIQSFNKKGTNHVSSGVNSNK